LYIFCFRFFFFIGVLGGGLRVFVSRYSFSKIMCASIMMLIS